MHVIAENWLYLARAAVNSASLAVLCIVVSTTLGVFIGVASSLRWRLIEGLTFLFVVIVRGVPLLVVLFTIYYSLPTFGWYIDPYPAAVIGLSFYFTFFISEVVRGAINAIPRGQVEAAKSLGLSFWKRACYVILPQALRAALPPIINLWVILVKGTSYASVISVWELTLASREVAQRTVAPFQIFGLAMLIYFVICFLLTRLGSYAEARFYYKH